IRDVRPGPALDACEAVQLLGRDGPCARKIASDDETSLCVEREVLDHAPVGAVDAGVVTDAARVGQPLGSLPTRGAPEPVVETGKDEASTGDQRTLFVAPERRDGRRDSKETSGPGQEPRREVGRER